MFYFKLAAVTVLAFAGAPQAYANTLVATFYYAAGDFDFTDEQGGGDTFDFVELDGERHFMTPGEPMMPLVNAAFAVPWGSTVNSVSVTASTTDTLEGDYYVYPAQEQAELGEGDTGWTPPVFVGPHLQVWPPCGPT